MARLEAITRWFQAPTPAPFDTDYAAFAESLELAMVALYNDTLLKLTGENVATAARFRDHHQQHAQEYASLAAGKAKGAPNNALIFVKTPAIQAAVDEPSALRFLVALEDQMAETYAYGLGLLTTPDIYRRVVTTLPVESQHAAVLGTKVPLTPDEQFITGPFVNASVGDGSDPRRGFDMGTFPVG
jgi:Ferritin-like domain